MAYSSNAAVRGARVRQGAISRTIVAGCALAALTAGAGFGVFQYVDVGGVLGHGVSAPDNLAEAAAPQYGPRSLFDPRPSPGAGGFAAGSLFATPPAPPQRAARLAAAPQGAGAPRVAAAAPAQKPTPLPDEALADEALARLDAGTDAPLPAPRPATLDVERTAEAAADLAPTPPRRPDDLASAPQRPGARPAEARDVAAARSDRPQERVAQAPIGVQAPVVAQQDRPSMMERPPAQGRLAARGPARLDRGPTAGAVAGTDHFERIVAAPERAGAPRLAAREDAAATGARARMLSRRSRSVVARNVEEPSFFQKLFGSNQAAPRGALAYAPASRMPGDTMALATASLGAPSRRVAALGPDRETSSTVAPRPSFGGGRAVYDVAAQAIFMPDGTRLEAHSGLGQHRDDSRSEHLRMRGTTPTHVYNLREREALFHGVRAIRLIPVGGAGAIYGRAGLLAHTFMLGPNGDSNGCVSIRDYRAFLNAFLEGKVTQLAVVDSRRGSSLFAQR